MLNLRMKSPEVYEVTDPLVQVSKAELKFLERALHLSPRQQARICTHKSIIEPLQEMFVIYSQGTYVRPHRHHGKDESVFVVQGEANLVFFDNLGSITKVVRMGGPTSPNAYYYCRVPAEIFHALLIRSEDLILFEAATGPFNPEETSYAAWAPAEAAGLAVVEYLKGLNRQILSL